MDTISSEKWKRNSIAPILAFPPRPLSNNNNNKQEITDVIFEKEMFMF